MPKQVDHEARRRQIAQALWRIASRDGLETASLSEVAAEAGVSKGLVQHYFTTKDQMIAFATAYANERMRERTRARILAASSSPEDVLRAILLELLPLEEDSRTGALVGIAFFFRALRQPELAADVREGYADATAALAEQITAAQKAGTMSAELDPAREADVLLMLASGLSSHILLGRYTPAQATDIIDYHISRLASDAR